jgi:hypothetical protein
MFITFHTFDLLGKEIDENEKLCGKEDDDVQEAVARTLQLGLQDNFRIRFGTVGHGVDLARAILLPSMGSTEWEGQTWDHAFSSQAKDVQACLPGRPQTAPELGTPWKVKHSILNDYHIDVLLVDDVDVGVWLP